MESLYGQFPTQIFSPVNSDPLSDYGNETQSSTSGDSSDDVEQLRKKQKTDTSQRGKYVAEACLECKRRHIKCDGEKPCGKCARKGIECIYHESDKKKRGPTAGATKYYLDVIRKLSDELDSVKAKLAEKESALVSRQNSAKMLLPADTLFKDESPLMISHCLQEYLQSYTEMYSEFLDIAPPSLQFKNYVNNEDVPSAFKLKWYSTLALGSQVFGDLARAAEYARIAREYAKDLYDETNDTVACEAVGAMEKSIYYNNMAKNILETLYDQQKLPPNKINLLASTLAGTAELTKDPNVMIYQTQRIATLKNVNKTNTLLSMILTARASLYLLEKEPNRVDLNLLQQQMEGAEKLVDVKSVQLSKSIHALILGTKARLYTVLKQDNMAVDCAKKALSLVYDLDKKRTCLATPVMVLTDTGVTFYTYDHFEEFKATFEKLNQIAENTPLTVKIISHLLDNLNLKDVPRDVNHFISTKKGCAVAIPPHPNVQDPNFYKDLVSPDNEGSPLCIIKPKTNPYPADILSDLNEDSIGVNSPIFDLRDLPPDFVTSMLQSEENL